MDETFFRYGLLAYFLAYFAVAFAWRMFVVFRLTGVNPLVLSSSDDVHGYVGRALKLLAASCAVVILLIGVAREAPVWLGSYAALRSPWISAAGVLLLGVSLAWLVAAQAQMGASWRIGIDTRRRTELVQHGLFSISRNPVFLAMRVTLAGLFLVFPAAATLVVLVAGEILMQVQVRLEEQHLLALHGEAYASYRSRVRRWL
jgi:protein-S-isoprenylcysteine O-methyltransferase Ste14